MAKIISFCLWGDKPQYTVGAIKNAELALEIYPGWECWFYMNIDEYDNLPSLRQYLDVLEAMKNVRILLSKYEKHHLMLSRFLPAGKDYSNPEYLYPRDDHIEVMLSRDCDSRLSLREKLAVDKWLASDKQFLVLKDHPWHAGVPVLGGLWGVKHGLLPDIEQMINDFIQEDPRNEWQCDQRFLTDKIWPKVQNTSMVFDPFYGGLTYPIPRDGFEFCGATHDENDKIPQEQIDLLGRHWRP
jgi:hypothetical protein